jgi:hypothetical protein
LLTYLNNHLSFIGINSLNVMGFLTFLVGKTSFLIDISFRCIFQLIDSSIVFFTIKILIIVGFIIRLHLFLPLLCVTKVHPSLSQFLDELGFVSLTRGERGIREAWLKDTVKLVGKMTPSYIGSKDPKLIVL